MNSGARQRIDSQLMMGAVTLSVADLARSVAYYQTHIGLTLLSREASGATLGVGARPLLHLHEQPGAKVVRRATGLFHFALLLPSRRALARTVQHFIDSNTPVSGASDHHVSEALYLSDPDGHGIEIYRDRPREAWVDDRGDFFMTTERLDFAGVMAELSADEPAWRGLPPETVMGHVHLQVADVAAAERFYVDVLGFDRMATYAGASFISADGYHHHVGLNEWAGRGVPAPPADAARLMAYEMILSSVDGLALVRERLRAAGWDSAETAHSLTVRDPSHNTVILRVAQAS